MGAPPLLVPVLALDAAFGGDGVVDTTLRLVDAGTNFDFDAGLAVQSDGKVLAAGSVLVSGATFTLENEFALLRFNADGTPDASFGSGGMISFGLPGTPAVAHAVTLDAAGRVLVAGGAWAPENFEFAVARLDSSGAFDASFSADGLNTVGFHRPEHALAIAIQPDGRILLGGRSYVTSESYYDFALVRLNADGSLDSGFGSGGFASTTVTDSWDQIRALALLPDGRILAAGTTLDDFALARYQPDGTLDTSFGTNGLVTIDFGGNDDLRSILVQADGKIVLAGKTALFGQADFALARLDAEGHLDAGFGTNGTLKLAIDPGNDAVGGLTQLADGSLLVAGVGPSSAVLVQLDADGRSSTALGLEDGIAAVGLGGNVTNWGANALFAPAQSVLLAYGIDGGLAHVARLEWSAGLGERVVSVDEPFALPLPDFEDPEGGGVSYAVTLADGSALPGWLSFDSGAHAIAGTATFAEIGRLQIKVTATDTEALSASDTFALRVDPQPVTGTAAADSIVGTVGNDSISALGGDDSVSGAGADDWIHGNAGSDTLAGGDGNDDLRGGKDDDLLMGSAGSDTLWGALGNDELHGGSENDLLRGRPQDDTLSGGTGDDTLTGGQGNDTLSGNDGDDLLQGRAGNDSLIGGSGNDLFWFNAAGAATADVINDFSLVDDWIELDSSTLVSLFGMAGSSPAEGNFLAGVVPVPENTNQLLLYDTATGGLYYDADGSGPTAAELIATLSGAPALGASDIFVV
jgi:uncharacterized delta-60 repeat protein